MTTLFIGLGRMGAPMAVNHATRFRTLIYDVTDDAAQRLSAANPGSDLLPLATLEDTAAGVDCVILMVPTSAHVESILKGADGLLHRLSPGTLVIDMGSSEPASTRTLAKEAEELQLQYVDAPVSGGVARADTGELSIMVGGSPDEVAAAMPHLETMGSAILVVGSSGAGHAAKALNNLVSAANLAVAAEAISVAEHFGIERGRMIEVLNASTGRSQASEVKYPQHILPGTYASGFAFDLQIKDIGIALTMAEQADRRTPISTATHLAARAAREDLGAGTDHTEFARWYLEHPTRA